MRYAAIITCALLSACATTPVPLDEARPVSPDNHIRFNRPAGGTAPVVVRRDRGFQAAACATRILVDGQLAAQIQTGEIVTLHVPAGDVVLGVEASGICAGGLVEIQARLTAGKPAHYRVGYDTNGALGLFPTATR